MALVQYGELLSVTTEIVPAGSRDGRSWQAFESEKLLVLSGTSAVEIGVGKAFDREEFLHLKQRASERPRIGVEVEVWKDRLYAKRLVQIDDEQLVPVA
jgi:hypothetical protein